MGTSVVYISFRPKPQDHPHACGDKKLTRYLSQLTGGSSPRVWGQVIKTMSQIKELGIIPTRVGTSHLVARLVVNSEDHPHACGDKFLPTVATLSTKGSSPRVWGQVAKQRN